MKCVEKPIIAGRILLVTLQTHMKEFRKEGSISQQRN